MPSKASAETQFFKHLKPASQKSFLSYGTTTLQKHISFMESSALTQPLVRNKGAPFGHPFSPSPSTGVTSKIKQDRNVWYFDDGCIGGDPRTVLSK